MAGKRLLDVAALFNASRGVLRKTIDLRSRQLDVYTRTSTLAKAVKNQTDRVTETAKAASILASRLNEATPQWAEQTVRSTQHSDDPIPSHESTKEPIKPSQHEEGLQQDHHYELSRRNTSIDPVPNESLDIHQEMADRYPLPDGTIPPASSNINIPKRDKDVVSSRPVEAVKEPLSKGDEALHPAASNKSTIPIPENDSKVQFSKHAREVQRQFEGQIPSHVAAVDGKATSKLSAGHDEDVTYEPSASTEPVLSSLPRVKIPKESGHEQGFDEHVRQSGINSDTYSSPIETSSGIAREAEQDDIPEGVNTNLFYSPRVSKMLGGSKYGARKESAANFVQDDSSLNGGGMHAQQSSTGDKQAGSTADDDVRELAETLKADANGVQSSIASVGQPHNATSPEAILITDSWPIATYVRWFGKSVPNARI